MADTEDATDDSEAPAAAGDGRAVTRLARRIRSFAEAHGGEAEGQISRLGLRGHRLVLVGADGGWGDLVAGDRAELALAAERAGVPLRESFDGELAARVRTGPYEWTRMAGLGIGGPGRRG